MYPVTINIGEIKTDFIYTLAAFGILKIGLKVLKELKILYICRKSINGNPYYF